ncbi:adenine deaminase C-terminal domain-containing protein [Natranaeroarchaeum aerophilus]|uniref:adenine deaminase n=1 Tax=Natranaeroarchaeum aerophilus TaxID=2917711 RepID=A0AAE3FPX9_9EURY|nr:adenine deaminase C-terminal domain-containing protein [Natranaeroarchaeum aerophilus]MCL9813006.1 amidohydrolase family protein [Natranaeroarchaeum aerophilus]
MNRTQAVALGEADADIAITGGRVFLPGTREFRSLDVAIVDNEIAALPDDATDVIGPETTQLSADGRVVLPGLIDAHTHVDTVQSLENAYHHLLATGTTTVITEASGLGSLFGARGVQALLAATAYLPITVRVTVPTMPLIDTFEERRASQEEAEALVDLLDDDRVVGVGETDWIHVVGRDHDLDELYERAHRAGKPICGHGAGCREEKLTAFAGLADNDHEAISGDGMIDRVERGIHTIGRYGTIRDDIDALADAVDRIGPTELSLSTDGMWPRDLLDEGAMDAVVRRTIDAGVDPADALRMATLNPARHFGLDDRGSLAPGNVADIVIVDDLTAMNVTTVLSGGEVVVEKGVHQVAPRSHEYPEFVYDSIDVESDPDTFTVPASAADADGRVRAIDVGEGLLSTETTVKPRVEDGNLHAAPERDVSKVALLDRHPDADGTGFTGFLAGYGIEEGAIATSMTMESTGVLAVGTSDDSLSTAVEHVEAQGGGWAVIRDGGAIAELPYRIAGVAADLEVEETAQLLNAVEKGSRSLGVDVDRPLLTLTSLPFVGVPTFKMTCSGYANVLGRSVVGLTPDEADE